MEKARCNTELYSNLRGPLNNVKPSNFWGSHHFGDGSFLFVATIKLAIIAMIGLAASIATAAAVAFSLILYALADLQNKCCSGGSHNYIYNNIFHLE